jgi:hypothetical protein
MLKKIVFFAALFLSCARQIPPSGGPDDKTPPLVRFTVPSIGTVRVAVRSKIVFIFSEWITTSTAQKAISVFPPPVNGLKVRAYGRRIEIRPVAAFAESTTYHIEINSVLTDLHANSIGSPFHYFFSTGATIDSGKVEGCIAGIGQKGLQPKVALFNISQQLPADTVLFSLPSYVVQTDSAGSFSFEHIRKGKYCIIGWADLNGNNRFEPDKEQAFGPEEKFFRLDSTTGPLALYPVQCDTSRIRITSIKPLSGRILSGSWSRPADSSAYSFFSQWRIEPVDAKSVVSCKDFLALPNSPNFFITLSDTTGLSSFRFIYKAPASALRAKNGPSTDTLRFNGIHAADTLRPAVLSFVPTGKAALRPVIKLVWSKPVRHVRTALKMGDTLGDTVVVSFEKRGGSFGDTTEFEVSRSLKPDRAYHLVLADSLFKDISGNYPRDSLFGKYTITTVSSENLCNSLSGKAPCAVKDARRKWLFLPINGSDRSRSNDSAGHFRFDSIPAGKGLIATFIDYNDDGLPTVGNLFPWVKPEPYKVFPDTIEARMRWDIEGVEAPACDVCARKPAVNSPSGPEAPGKPGKNISSQKVNNISDTAQ